jgi:PPOX class probable F420-dependent enzyme
MTIADEKYVLLTTFKRDGTAVASPVWIVGLPDGRVGFYTSSGSGKAKRLVHTPRVLLQPSNANGKKLHGEQIEANAVMVAGGPDFEAVKAAIVEKYGFMTKLANLFGTIGGIVKRKRIPYADRVVLITLPE